MQSLDDVKISFNLIRSNLTKYLLFKKMCAKFSNIIKTTHLVFPQIEFEFFGLNTSFIWYGKLPKLQVCLRAIFEYFKTKNNAKEDRRNHNTKSDLRS